MSSTTLNPVARMRQQYSKALVPLRVSWVYDMNACARPTGVTRHALGQRGALAARPDVQLTTVTGAIRAPEGRALWNSWTPRKHVVLPLGMRDMLRLWRLAGWPPAAWWTGPTDWIYCPAEYYVPPGRARLAVTSHDIQQDLHYGGPRRRRLLQRVFERADLILSVSDYNTSQLIDAFPQCAAKVALVPNAADALFHHPPSSNERALIRKDLGLPTDMPYLLSVANFQARKNLPTLLRAAGRLDAVQQGELAIVLIGSGSESETAALQAEIATLPPRTVVRLPGYREGHLLRAAYAEARALVFPSTCESFGIPAVEAMLQHCPVALANSTALPEIAGAAGWYFDPMDVDDLTETLRTLLENPGEARRRADLGISLAARFHWADSCDRLVAALNR